MESMFYLHIVCSRGWHFTKVFWQWNLQVYCWLQPTETTVETCILKWHSTDETGRLLPQSFIYSFYFIAVAFKMPELYKICHTAPTGNKLLCLLLPFYSLCKWTHTITEIPEVCIGMFHSLCPQVLFGLLAIVKTNLHVFFCSLANLYRK